ncbi:uncharacterized protein LOC117170120 [Belonocnema kinseyi]|uniref:uncharacterized protein LOC117170120 n=1 Tax=Belonocnema kinseyi TaxID=2817044 RepID=UPI00143D397E|nr:uncharacterized protein LOC117170120 [Belonocnema kinseyi]
MRKLTKRSIPPKEKVKLPQHVVQMTVAEGSGDNRRILSPASRRNQFLKIGNESESWDRQSGTTTVSWPEDMEELATRKVIQQWETLEKTLYEENDQLPVGPVFDECLQWRNQLPHFRLVGKNLIKPAELASKTNSSLKRKPQFFDTRENDDLMKDDNFLLDDSENSSPEFNKRAREDVVDELMEYVNSTLVFREEAQEENSLSRDLEEFLTITPAPTNSFRNTASSHKQIHKDDDFLGHSDSKKIASRSKMESESRENEKYSWKRDTTSGRHRGDVADMNENLEVDELDRSHLGRNKPGTVFNKKVVVSPVPFVRSTRESFCTIKTAPIQILGQQTNTSWNPGTRIHINSGQRIVSGKKSSLIRMPQVHSAWQPPVCPTIWPKNVRLAPIDTSRLPSSKQRTLSAVIPHRGRTSLSPISRTALATTSQNSNANQKNALEIHGTHILGQYAKTDGLKSNLNPTPRIKNNGRKKARHKAENL